MGTYRERQVLAVRRLGQLLPLFNVRSCDRLYAIEDAQCHTRSPTLRATYAIVRGPHLIPGEFRDLRHRLYADNTLDRKVRLVGETAREVVRAELARGYQGIRYQELCPLVEQTELRGESECFTRASRSGASLTYVLMSDKSPVCWV